MTKPGEVYDKNGVPIYPGDLLRTFHFTGPRRRKWYLYHTAIFNQQHQCMEGVPTSEIEPSLVGRGGRFWLHQEIMDGEQCEVIEGPSIGEHILYTERPRRKKEASDVK